MENFTESENIRKKIFNKIDEETLWKRIKHNAIIGGFILFIIFLLIKASLKIKLILMTLLTIMLIYYEEIAGPFMQYVIANNISKMMTG